MQLGKFLDGQRVLAFQSVDVVSLRVVCQGLLGVFDFRLHNQVVARHGAGVGSRRFPRGAAAARMQKHYRLAGGACLPHQR